ncbi:MAG: DNA translocase FtsK [Oscillospiraceae bacterium]|nr:DNA translocase FtsK [Oscillospiraceae bacterium]
MIGRVGFYVSIPALLYLFIIHAFSNKRPITMRTICLISSILICGCLHHLSIQTGDLGSGGQFIANLYVGGATGNTGGLVCGLIAMLLRWLCGNVISYIILIVAGVFTILASMQITIPSLVRAVENRPRADWEDEEAEETQPEPAAIVVNHLARKRIERIENRRRQKEEEPNIDIPLDGEPKRKKKDPPNPKADGMIRQIDEIDTPVGAAEVHVPGEPVSEPADTMFGVPGSTPGKPPMEEFEEDMDDFSAGMPRLIDEVEDIPAAVPPAPVEPAPGKVTAKEAAASAVEVAAEIAENEAMEKPVYCFPPIDLLKNAKGGAADGTAEMRENSRRLNETLASFKIEAHIINVTRGPSVTRYEVELEKGVRLNKLTTVADDIALSLGASGVRIAAVPGKISVVGIEVPNRAVTTVSLREVIDSNEFNKAKSKSSFAVGKDIGGNCIVGNIAKLPHMLIAGTTGSGKSVCMNSIIISLLYKASPEDVKLIMVDPKMVELGIYNGIPHLLIPVVTDPKKAAGSLQWAVNEMMRRYKSMSDAGVRDLEAYNSIMESEEDGHKLPQVVVIIDELADLMLVAAKEVEESICRIAQMGRAAGIHLIIATQRPSADVITGLMKANIPSRIAFAVASAMESRIILDTQGAEKLVGRGDMLFAPIGSGKPLRVQGCFVSDPEVEAVATYVKENYINNYDQSVMEEIERKAAQAGTGKATVADPDPNDDELDGDEMLPAAVDVILETGQASVSMLQRRLKLGYARAARIVDEMEEKGIVGPFQGSKPRSILITKEQWEAMKGGTAVRSDVSSMSYTEGVPEEFD